MEWTRTSEGFRRRRRAIRRRRNKARLLKTCLVLGWVAGLGGAATIISVEFVGLR